MSRPIIYFSRHGLTDWNITKRIQGQVDRDITDVGRAQALGNGKKLKELIGDGADYDFVASTLRRTRETMELIRTGMDVDPKNYRTEPLLMELHFGDWQGSTEDEIGKINPEQIKARHQDKWNFVPPGDEAESYAMLAKRFNSWLQSVSKNTVCVTHGGCVRSLFHLYGGLSECEAANMDVLQDKIIRFQDNNLEWI